MSKINPKFEDWKIYLTKFIGGKMYSLDIRANNGEITCWMLKNLCINSYSNVYSIDTWINCAKCGDKIENEFTENVLKTGKIEQNIKMKSDVNDALIKIKSMKFIIFDFIYINTQDYPGDVFTNIVISWEILNEEGIMIISNFKVSDDKEGFKIKTAIDTFISINKLQLEILDSEDYYIIKKLNQKYTHSPMIEYDNLYEEINNFKNKNVDDVVFDDIIGKDLEFELKISPEIKIVIPTINKDGISNYDLLPLIYDIKNQHDIIKFYLKIIKKYNLTSIIKLNKNKLILEYLLNISLCNKYIKNNNTILINYKVYIDKKENSKINLLIKNIYKNIKINNKIIDDKYIYEYIINKYKNNKFNIILFDAITDIFRSPGKNSINNIYLLIHICIALNMQGKMGKFILYANVNINIELLIECIYILKIYYRKIIIINNNNRFVNADSGFYIIAEDFLGIDEHALDDINLLINNIYNNINNNINNNNNNVRLLKNYNQEILDNIKNKMNDFINQKIQNSIKIITLYDKTYNFIKQNNEILNNNIKLILFKLILNNIII